jgi:N-acetylmuramoyl-L-alanine amidase
VTDRHRTGPGGRARHGVVLVMLAASLMASACGVSAGSAQPQAGIAPAAPARASGSAVSGSHSAGSSAGRQQAGSAPGGQTAGSGVSGKGKAAKPLAGKIIGIDPGHNGRNYTDPAFLDRQIWNGREWEDCDTTGTSTNGGYSEARYNWNVARYLRADLRRDGAKLVLTRHSNRGVGPCVTRRAQIINHGHASVAIDIHADGGPSTGRGFAILEPVADGPNDHVISSSERFGRDLKAAFLADTPMPTSTYDGVNGFTHRDDLAGLNLTRVPKVLIETGNMRNATDARLLTSARFQRQAARAITRAIVRFLRKR